MTVVHDLNAVAPGAGLGNANTVEALLHDLRQPIKAILLFAGSNSGDPVHRLEAISAQARWMAALVEEVLGSRPRRPMDCLDVSVITMEAVERARDTAPSEMTFFGEADLYAWVDGVALGRAIACVIDNATRAAGPDGHVTVSVRTQDDRIAIVVRDDGPGPGRIESQTSLGLTVTRAIVSSFDGTFELAERAAGGTRALITLPCAAKRDRYTGVGMP